MPALILTEKSNIQAARWAKTRILWESETSEPSDVELPTKIKIMNNEVTKGDYDLANKIHIEMSESEKTAYGNEWRTYQ